ncbi:MAG: TonB family protein [Acidobacteriota bacterium]
MRFTVAPSGAVSDISLSRSSGSARYDRAARRAIQLASPLPPLPRSTSPGSTPGNLTVHFEFIP